MTNINADVLAINSVRGDEYFTLEKDVRIIADNLIPNLNIWCPFDTEESHFPHVLREYGHTVTATSSDFFTTEPPPGCNAVVSNPPFSRKKEVLRHLKDLNLPFALILHFLFLNDGVPLDYGHQIILFRKRIHFIIPEIGELNKPRTNCFVLSNGLLKNDFTIVRN